MNRGDGLTECYEQMRRQALARLPGGATWGLVVLRTKGMASWTKTWQEHTDGVPRTPGEVPAMHLSPLATGGDELVQVLAGMVWALRREEGA